MSPDPTDRASAAHREAVAETVGKVALDVEAVRHRATRAVERLEALDAEPNVIVAARHAVEELAGVAARLRRDAWLSSDQQRLL